MMREPNSNGARSEAGFALAIVLWTVAITSIVGLTLAASIQSEVRVAIAQRESLRAELLAESGLEFADYLANRGLGAPNEDLAGLPVRAITSGFHYRGDLAGGEIDLYLEGEDGKIGLSFAPKEIVEPFFAVWRGEPARGAQIAAAIEDWRDTDDEQSLFGAEALSYSGLGYTPRNAAFGPADPLLLRGLSAEDFMDQVIEETGRIVIRPGLDAFVTTDPVPSGINPNLAAKRVLMAIPGMSESVADAIVAARERTFFTSVDQLSQAVGGLALSVREHLRLGPSGAGAVLALGRTEGGVRRSIRRVRHPARTLDPFSGRLVPRRVINRIERNVLPEFVR